MTELPIGTRVRSLISLDGWNDTAGLPTGSAGTVTHVHHNPAQPATGYGVVFDDLPERLPVWMPANALEEQQ